MTDNQFWWANLHNHDHVKVVEVEFEDGKPHRVYVAGSEIHIDHYEFERCQVRLIEQVLPAGRAAAAVEKLLEAFDIRDEGAWVTVRKAAELLQDGENRT